MNIDSNLKELINRSTFEILLEIRTGFRWAEFKKLDTGIEQVSYANEHLKFLGAGSSRTVYLLSNRYVLKMAIPHEIDKGTAQNEAEVDLYTNPKIKPIIAQIYDAATDYSWIVSELVKPLSNKEEFFRLTGISTYDLDYLFEYMEESDPEPDDWIKDMLATNKFVKQVVELVSEGELRSGDVVRHGHWGKTSSGRLVLLDYGFTVAVDKAHYNTGDSPSGGTSFSGW